MSQTEVKKLNVLCLVNFAAFVDKSVNYVQVKIYRLLISEHKSVSWVPCGGC